MREIAALCPRGSQRDRHDLAHLPTAIVATARELRLSYTDAMRGSLDRFQEAHFYLHQMERFYHEADPFRYSLNSFIRALKEVPQLVSMELQNHAGFPTWFRKKRDELRSNDLLLFLHDQRNFIVHRGTLLPASNGAIGITESRAENR